MITLKRVNNALWCCDEIEANTPAFTAKMSNSLLGASKEYVDNKFSNIDLSEYYTKSQIDSKLPSVYKYQGTVSIPLWLPIANQNVGDVYNIHNGHTSKAIKEFTGGTLTSVNYKYSDNVKIITATFDGISDSGFGKVNSYIGLVLDCSPIDDNYSVDGKIIGIEGSTFIIDASAGTAKDSTDPGNSWTIVDGFTTLPVSIKSGRYSSSYVQTFNDGANVAWTGTTWDELGTTVDISAKADKSTTLAGKAVRDDD